MLTTSKGMHSQIELGGGRVRGGREGGGERWRGRDGEGGIEREGGMERERESWEGGGELGRDELFVVEKECVYLLRSEMV